MVNTSLVFAARSTEDEDAAAIRAWQTAESERAETSGPRSKINYLSAMEIFRDLSPEQIAEYHHSITMRTCKAGYVFYTPGETGEVLFFLKTGGAQIYRLSPEGRKLVTETLPQYSFFGEMSVIGQGMYDSFAEATEDSVICTISRRDIVQLILSRPLVGLRILEAVGKRMVATERQLEALAFKGLIPRVAALLLREAVEEEVRGLSHQDIAERLGIYRETATHAMAELKSAGIIGIGRKLITIMDRKRLERAAAE